MVTKTETAFRKQFRSRLGLVRAMQMTLNIDWPESAAEARRAAVWRVLLKGTPEAKLRRAGNPRIRRSRIVPRLGR
jgi:hypothetical protein